MGLSDGESKAQRKPKKKVTVDEDEETKPALATLDKFIGKSSNADDVKPGRKLTNLDKLLKKAEEGGNNDEAQGITRFRSYFSNINCINYVDRMRTHLLLLGHL